MEAEAAAPQPGDGGEATAGGQRARAQANERTERGVREAARARAQYWRREEALQDGDAGDGAVLYTSAGPAPGGVCNSSTAHIDQILKKLIFISRL